MSVNKSTLEWFYTDGGPYICIPNKHLREWGGSGDSEEQPSGDYKRACEIKIQVGVIQVGSGEGLVLDTESNQVAWYSLSDKKNNGMFVVWEYANSEEDILNYLENIPEDIWQDNSLKFKVDDENLTIIGAADEGDGATWGSLSIELEKGVYKVYTAEYKPDKETSLILHRLDKKG